MSPDGQKIAFESRPDNLRRDGNSEIYVIKSDGSGKRNLTRIPAEDDCCFAWAPLNIAI